MLLWSNDSNKLIDIKHLGKFCKKFIFNISKCIVNLSLIVSGGSCGWTTQLVL